MCTDSVLRDGIKVAVVAQTEQLKKFHEVPRLGAEGHKSAMKYMYEYMRCCASLHGIKTEESSYENMD
jgi:hypothetical protein